MIYFIKPIGIDGPIKIGYTKGDVDERLNGLQSGSPFPLEVVALIEGTIPHERALHWKFFEHRSHGEWFNKNPEMDEMLDLINSGRFNPASLELRYDAMPSCGFRKKIAKPQITNVGLIDRDRAAKIERWKAMGWGVPPEKTLAVHPYR